MTTLLTAETDDGTRRCTESCHHAQGDICDCICGGRYHGVALRDGGLDATVKTATAEELAKMDTRAKQLGFAF